MALEDDTDSGQPDESPYVDAGNRAPLPYDAEGGSRRSNSVPMDVLAQFCAAIARAGLPVPDTVTADGAPHRFSTNGDARDETGWYVLCLDGIPSGAFGCECSGLPEMWCARESSQMSTDEHQELIRRMEHVQQQLEADCEQRQLAAADTAARLWEAAQPAPAAHPYLVRKQIQPHGIRSDGNTLILPMYDGAGRVCSLQFIDGAGQKRFLSGGRVAGCYYPIDGECTTVYLAEGFATGAAIAEASGAAVMVAFAAGQLPADQAHHCLCHPPPEPRNKKLRLAGDSRP